LLHVLRTQAELAMQHQNKSCTQVYYDAMITNVNLKCLIEKLSNDDDGVDRCSSLSLSSSLLFSSVVCIGQGTSLSIRSHSM